MSGALLGTTSACQGDRPMGPGRDTIAPMVQVVFPTAGRYDLDSNGLVDIRIRFNDSLGRVDPARTRLRLLDSGGLPFADSNLFTSWRLVFADDSGFAIEETLGAMLRAGPHNLEIEVADTSGNIRRDTIALILPEAELVRSMETGLGTGWTPAERMTICPDDSLLYVTVNDHLWIVDPVSFRTVLLVPPVGSTTAGLGEPVCTAGDPYLYISEDRIRRFNRVTREWESDITHSFSSVGLAASRLNPALLFEGETYDGVIGVISRTDGPRRQLLTYSALETNIYDVVVTGGDAKLYASYGDYGGIWVVDPARDSVLKRIRVGGPSFDGFAQNMALSADEQRLYAAVTYGDPTGVVEIDTQTDSVVRTLRLDNARPVNLALSPDGRRMFVSVHDKNAAAAENVLVDVATMTAIRFFSRPRPAGSGRYDRGVIFRPDGHYIFVTHDSGLDIYINRP